MGRFTVVTCGNVTKDHRFPKLVWHTTSTVKLVSVDQWRITFLMLNV